MATATRIPILAALVVVVAGCAAPPAPAESVATSPWPVGAATRRLVPLEPYEWRGATTHALITRIWYPAAAGTPMSDHAIGPPDAPLFRLGQWQEDAVPAAGRFPLIALSHGTGGSAEVMAWLARGLAARGYIVAGVNHPGNNALEPPYTPEGFLVWWERARDLTVVIDDLLGDDEFGRRIDPARIGAAGFSLGGYTMIEIAGGRTDPTLFLAFCRSPAAEGCVDPPEFPNLFARWAELMASDPAFQRTVSQASQSYRDPRVRAVFAIAPALGPAFIPESLLSITTPVSIVVGPGGRSLGSSPLERSDVCQRDTRRDVDCFTGRRPLHVSGSMHRRRAEGAAAAVQRWRPCRSRDDPPAHCGQCRGFFRPNLEVSRVL